jgi:hypothetical protein
LFWKYLEAYRSVELWQLFRRRTRNFMLATYEDLVVEHPKLGGIKYGQERGGPLHAALRGESPTCFCEVCRDLLARRGYDPDKARRGYEALVS